MLQEHPATDSPDEPSDAPHPNRAFEDLPREHGFEPVEVVGEIPEGLAVTLYRVGPVLLQPFGEPYPHWFDGDGGVTAFRIDRADPRAASRVVQSEGLRYERAKGRPVTGGYATKGSKARSVLALMGLLPMSRVIKNAANTSVLAWQDRVFALWEAGRPTEVDPATLETLGETSFDGVVPWAFSAHPHRVPARRATYGFGIRYGPKTRLDLFELPDEGAARHLSTMKLPRPTMIHDFVVTDRHMVFFLSPLHLRSLRIGLGLGSFSDNLVWQPHRGTDVLVVPIDAPEERRWLQTDPFWAWHFANGYERVTDGGSRTGEIVIDVVRYPDFSSNRWVADVAHGRGSRPSAGAAVWRAVLDLGRGRIGWERRWEHPCEFPRIHPERWARPYRYVWMAAHQSEESASRRPWDRLVRYDTETGERTLLDLGGGRVPTEPIFVPRPGAESEDDGWVLALVYDPARHASYVTIIDARRFEDGAVAELWLDHHVPPTLHGTVAPL